MRRAPFARRLAALLAAALLAAFGLGGCQGSKGQETSAPPEKASSGIATKLSGPVEITFWHAMTGKHEEALRTIAENFTKEHPDIRIKLEAQGNYGDLQQKLTAAAKSHTLPVMAQVIETWVTDFRQNGLVADLTPYIENPEIGWNKQELDDIVEVFRKANQWDGKYYSLPFSKSTQILYYNTDYFQELGLQPPKTWDELKEAAKKLTGEKNGRRVIGMGFENSVGWQFHQWVKQAGGRYVDEATGEVLFDSPEGREALGFLVGLFQEEVARLAGEDQYVSNPFGRGDVGMYIGSSAGIPFVAKAAEGNIHWAAAPVPAGEEKAVAFAGNAVAVFDSAKPEEKLAAWLFIKYLLNTDNTVFWAKSTGYLPIRYSALETKEWQDYVAQNPAYGVGTRQFDYGFFDPRIPGFDAALKEIDKEIQAALLGQKSADAALRDAARAAQAAIDRAKERAK
ncbi:MAG: Glycerol-3-phosphate ABC transporter, periplasmic glycerol-3-phosphate-binding protein [Brockia lithotrophica]|uniref:Glycerol-3-phosphate ABC transporter, periplasmic glycerol-3-phosphate-binding protein n=1 Tax=Brockia lithotrophica TaxID=933949 RepID=A0A2T5G6B4_9BACL|nr:ABC transporter substrate-binding protein [Brockia lithotrophica]PTQ51723.1 MAG: Glycerol-3-phosphate ABC transporter, periplasmic glycerol-3-phosphate-binding protein [Brockia lithotrophica]